MEKVKVGVNGYGVIGKRIADAVLLQDDMELVGVTARTPDCRLFSAYKKGIKVFGVDSEACNRLMNSGVKCNGDFNHFIKKVNVVVDATPAGIGKAYMALARRGTDPVDSHEKGPLGTVTLGHLHIAFLRLNKEMSKQKTNQSLGIVSSFI